MDNRTDRFSAMLDETIRLSDQVHQCAGQNDSLYDELCTRIAHMRLAVDNIAWLAHIDMKRLPGFWEKKVNVGRQIRACLGALNWMVKEKYLHVNTELEDVEIEADPDLTRVIWENLLDNSIKFTKPHGHIWIEAKVAGNYIEVTFRDDGAGILKEVLPEVFDRFCRYGDPSTPGLGAGLSVVKEGALWQGGKVDCASKPGEGSTFRVSLPIKREIH